MGGLLGGEEQKWDPSLWDPTGQATASEGRVQERSTRSGLSIFVLSQGEDQQRAENSPLSFPEEQECPGAWRIRGTPGGTGLHPACRPGAPRSLPAPGAEGSQWLPGGGGL